MTSSFNNRIVLPVSAALVLTLCGSGAAQDSNPTKPYLIPKDLRTLDWFLLISQDCDLKFRSVGTVATAIVKAHIKIYGWDSDVNATRGLFKEHQSRLRQLLSDPPALPERSVLGLLAETAKSQRDAAKLMLRLVDIGLRKTEPKLEKADRAVIDELDELARDFEALHDLLIEAIEELDELPSNPEKKSA